MNKSKDYGRRIDVYAGAGKYQKKKHGLSVGG